VSQQLLNLGILAHVDAGKTTLTERLLYGAGVIDELGSVDDGTTQTDSLELERRRGITIRSAVVSFAIGDVTVNLIDTPGHPDFIAEVERVLSVLDGAVLVLSAVEGVQSQTLVLMRALQRLSIPTLIFVNKIDRAGADDERVLRAISERLTPAIVPMGTTRDLGTRAAGFAPWGSADRAFRARLAESLAERDEGILAAYVDNGADLSYDRLWKALAAQTKSALVHPVFFGSALTGAGVEPLTAGIAELLPSGAGDPDGAVAGSVFKIERGASGERIAYVRVFSGTVRTRDLLHFGDEREAKVTAIDVFDNGSAVRRTCVGPGEIAQLWGLGVIQIGDRVGMPDERTTVRQFAPPMLESVVVPVDPDDGARLRTTLGQLAEQDPLIDVRWDDDRRELSVSLYGEVQKEILQATLADDFDLEVDFRETTTIHVERPAGSGEAVEILHAESNPFSATIGLRVDPAPAGSGIEFRLQVEARVVPLYLYKSLGGFSEHMESYVRESLREGLYGWQVTDCLVTMIDCNYSSPDGPPATRGGLSSPSDYRKLTPLVLMQALERAGTLVCEPIARVRLEVPTHAIGAVLPALARSGAAVAAPSLAGQLSIVETIMPAARVNDLQRQLPRLTGGEGALETEFAGYHPVNGERPTRRRTTPNPLNREEYLMHLAHRVPGR
jgi:ribosomal protection tetracycline resistance protein